MRRLNTADKNMIKEINTKAIFKIIRDFGPISRADIAKKLKITPVTVSANVLDLIENELVLEVGSGESKGGRRPILLEMNPDAQMVVSVDMGIEKVAVGIVNIAGEIVSSITRVYNESVLDTVELAIEETLKATDISHGRIIGIGMGVHGIVDHQKGLSVFAPAFGWKNKDIVSGLKEKFNLPVRIENDAKAMTIAEKWFGKAKNVDNFILVNIGEGIGSGIYIDGHLFRGYTSGAGEVGHIAVSSGDYPCECGSRGCLTTVASAKGIVNRFMEIENGLTDLEGDNLTSEAIYNQAIAGDRHSVMVLKKTGEYIGKALSILTNLFNPQMIILSGGVAKSYHLMDDVIDDVVNHESLYHNKEAVDICESEMKETGGLIGAAMLFIEDLFETDNFRM